jgi:hypothetical protein
MAYLGFEQLVSAAAVKDVDDLTIPANATYAEIQASGQNASYTCDDSTDPTQTAGMVFLTTHAPKAFGIDDVRRIRFVRAAGSDGNLNFHYFGGRDV